MAGTKTLGKIKAYPWILVHVPAEGVKHFGKTHFRVVNHTWVLPAVVCWVVAEGTNLQESWEHCRHKTLVIIETLWQNLLKSGKSHLHLTCSVVDQGRVINLYCLRTLQAQDILNNVVNMPLVCDCLGIYSKLFMLSDGWREFASKLLPRQSIMSCQIVIICNFWTCVVMRCIHLYQTEKYQYFLYVVKD